MSQSNLGKVTVNFVSREIVHMIEFLRMIFVLKKSSYLCFKISLQGSVKEIRHVDMTIKQIRREKKRFPYRCSNIFSLLNGLLIAHRAKKKPVFNHL